MGSTSSPLQVIIVGAGIGGLTAATALRQQGHHVTIIEKSSFLQEAGAAIGIGANVSGLLRDLGLDLPAWGAVECLGMVRYNGEGQVASWVDFEALVAHWSEVYYLIHRVDLHMGLKQLAMDPEGKGPVPRLVLGAKVVNVDAMAGVVTVRNGTEYHADVIIGADGVHSVMRSFIAPEAIPVPSGKSCYRWVTPREVLLKDELVKAMFDRDGWLCEIFDNETKAVMYPCRNHELINAVCFVNDDFVEENSALSNKEIVLKSVENLSPSVQKLFSYADEDIKLWRLYHMEEMPKWSQGKLVLMGDALHPMLPFLGQGGAMAIEDAITLGALLHQQVQRDQIQARLEMYHQIRRERVAEIQWGSRVRALPDGIRPKEFEMGKAMEYSHNFNVLKQTNEFLEQKHTASH